jgi:hypothetical protein
MTGRPLAATILAFFLVANAHAQVVQPKYWGTDGEVTSIARVGNTIYLSGTFSNVGPATGGAVPIDRVTGMPLAHFPRVNGVVHVIVSDGNGGWFVGGDFTAVEGQPHHNVAHLLDDGTVARWDPGVADVEYAITSGIVNPIHTVSALALDGDVLYVGGRFETVGGQPHHAIAAVSARTGAVSSWNPHADGVVTALATDRGTLFVGGSFTTMSGQPRSDLAAFRLADGSLTPWRPAADGTVLAIAFARNLIWVGGEFDHVDGQSRNSIAAVARDTGSVTSWDAGLQPLRRYIAHGDRVWPYVSGIVIHGNCLFAGGYFDFAGGSPRYSVAELDLGSARATDFDARIGGGLAKALALHGQTLFIGGYVVDFGGAVRPNLAAVDARTGIATSWNPRADATTLTLAANGRTVMAGGEFTSMADWQPRTGLAALDATTGRALPWNPTLDVPYYVTLVAGDDRVYAAGQFTSVNGQPRGHFAAFEGATGTLSDWNPWTRGVTAIDSRSIRMATIGSALYVTAPVESINGVRRHNLFALDGRTGALLPWAPSPEGRFRPGHVDAINSFGTTLFVAGEFDTIGGATRTRAAQLDATTGLATAWTPDVGILGGLRWYYPYSILSTGESTFLGGWFYDLADHGGLLTFGSSGSFLETTPSLGAEYNNLIVGDQPAANALAQHGNTLFVAGRFDTIAGSSRCNLGALDATTGALLPWDADMRGGFFHPFDHVSALMLTGDVLYVGGSFTRLGGYAARNFAALDLAPAWALRRRPHSRDDDVSLQFALTPNPARGVIRLEFTLPAQATVTVGIFDIAGRRVATPLDKSLQTAGEHSLSLGALQLRSGVYYCRLDAGGVQATRRFVVLD